MGPGRAVGVVAHRAWATRMSLGLRADLRHLPPRPEARVRVVMEPVDTAGFDALRRALRTADRENALEILERERMRAAGVKTLYVAFSEDREPIYLQWLIDP